MFNKIIWATDGSEHADRALELVRSLVAQGGGTVLAVHSVEYLVGPGAHGAPPELPDDDERLVKIRGQVAALAEQGVAADMKVVQGGSTGAAHTIAEVAAQEGADLIVVGTRGHSPIAGLLLGGVTQRLLQIAPCPVLVAPA